MAEHWSPKPGAVGSNPTGPAIYVTGRPLFWGNFDTMFKKLFKFLHEVRLEMKKVTWPTRKEITGSTVVVIITVIIVAIYLGVIDNILQYAIRLLIKY